MLKEKNLKRSYLLADYISTNIALLLFNVFRYYNLPKVTEEFWSLSQFLLSPTLVVGQIVFPLFMLLIYYMSGVVSEVYLRSRAQELLSTVCTAFIGAFALFFAVLINDLTLDRTHDYSLFLVLFALLFVVVYIPRVILTTRTQHKLLRGEINFPTLIIGYSSVPQLFPRQLQKLYRGLGTKVVGLIDSENRAQFSSTGTDLPIYNLSDIDDVCRRLNVARLLVIPHPKGWVDTLDVVNKLFRLDIPTLIAAEDLPGYLFNTELATMRTEPYIDITRSRLSASTLNIKRATDVVVSAIMLLLTAIPIAFTAVLIKIDSRGPVFYRQRRVGLHKREFNIVKLRTMHQRSEADGPTLSSPGDARVTRVGRILRKYRIDELPQFYNVLVGDMSIVGPRPERPHYVALIIEREPAYTLLFRVRPGITSLGMVKYGYATSVDEMITRSKFDMLYLENISIVTDLKIILHTARTVLNGEGI
ncbi:MAG: exopolysaccharide biosynthesis polyprenyl glycosylphosphotransferase [Bacteroides sp.]|nr:exopolysaccharide biosynthesis polyprenyl glycosylphosphotransferase [Bacteroides sp.]MCM1413697.1 exopolysaccharide biosynthesis polyprenyl glycosylphosphotransferase [Bacteroides sp.]MCM1471876.1 exopolysaccharide biosynthesis polyprenyl glycosylphosphotransferase [Bacteroides sp.]